MTVPQQLLLEVQGIDEINGLSKKKRVPRDLIKLFTSTDTHTNHERQDLSHMIGGTPMQENCYNTVISIKDQNINILGFIGPNIIGLNILGFYSLYEQKKTIGFWERVIGNVQITECGCILIKFYLQESGSEVI